MEKPFHGTALTLCSPEAQPTTEIEIQAHNLSAALSGYPRPDLANGTPSASSDMSKPMSARMDTVAKNLPSPSNLLSAMANPKRLQILCLLAEREMPVGRLAEQVGLSQPAISQHLSRLRQERIVETRRESQMIHYRIRTELVNQILQTLDDYYGRPWRAGFDNAAPKKEPSSTPSP